VEGEVAEESLKGGVDLRAGVAWGWWSCSSLLGSGSQLTAWDSYMANICDTYVSYRRRPSKGRF